MTAILRHDRICVTLLLLVSDDADANDANLRICPYRLNFDPTRSTLTEPVHDRVICAQIWRNSFQLPRHGTPILWPASLFFELFIGHFVQPP
jgi:hypothetical protein